MNYLQTVIGGIIRQAYLYMERTNRPDSFERFPYLGMLAERFVEPERALSGEESAYALTGEDAETKKRYELLLKRLCGEGEFGRKEKEQVLKTAADLALASALLTEFAAYLNYYTGKGPTLQLAFEMCGQFCPDYVKVTQYRKLLGQVLRIEKKNLSGCADIEAGHELFSYLAGDDDQGDSSLEEELMGNGRFRYQTPLHPMYIREELADTGANLLEQGGYVLYICGEGGKRFLVKHIAKRLKKDVLFVRADKLCKEQESPEEPLGNLVRRAFLFSCMVCIYEGESAQIKKEEVQMREGLSHAVHSLVSSGIPIILCMKEYTDVLPTSCKGKERIDQIPADAGFCQKGMLRIGLAPLTRAERQKVWAGFAKQYDLKEDIEQCSIKYRMNAREIAEVVEEWRRCGTAVEGENSISGICCRVLSAGEKEKLGMVQTPEVSMTDLIVPEAVRRTLKEICCGALKSYRIYEEWGLEGQYPYGKNISVLLAGAPGTGKTMTAHVLAHEIGMPLYQVDLPHVMDKYIGETEKRLEQIFAFAEKANMVLFFDEADALFGKRGEVTEGKDRYANMEVSYLLQRMEQFDGIVILATNFYQNIDKAFLRRIKYVLRYQEPDEEMRRRMWESCLTPQLPREAIDTDYLARQFPLSGGMIKNVMQCACISAVYEERPLCMEHVLRAVRMEYEKLERSISPQMWGEYGYLMDESLR